MGFGGRLSGAGGIIPQDLGHRFAGSCPIGSEPPIPTHRSKQDPGSGRQAPAWALDVCPWLWRASPGAPGVIWVCEGPGPEAAGAASGHWGAGLGLPRLHVTVPPHIPSRSDEDVLGIESDELASEMMPH